MLDDLTHIHQVDKSDALGIAAKEPEQLTQHFDIDLSGFNNIKNVVYAGMGGSALAADLSRTWPAYKVPFELARGYSLPAYVNSETLCLIASFSGNTEEMLSSLADAEAKGAQIVVLSSGGELVSLAQQRSHALALLPPAKQPRYGVFSNFKALLEVINRVGVSKAGEPAQLQAASERLTQLVKAWEPTVPIRDNLAKQIALDCLGKSVVIYAGPLLAPAAYKWKISFNENAKQVAWWNQYSEFNHNEFIGWSEQPVDKPYCVIDLRSDLEDERIKQRFELSAQLLSGRRPDPLVVRAEGSNILEHLLYCVLLGDFVSLYAAIAAGNDPEPVALIEKFKRMLTEQR